MRRLLIANRGEIACRIMRTAQQMHIRCIAVYSDADRNAQHVRMADEAVSLGGETPVESYLDIEKVIAAAQRAEADAIHPGYGFLSENATFAAACAEAGIIFVGPPVAAIEAMGSKSAAKAIMQEANVPLLPGYHDDDQSAQTLLAAANRTGFPILLKAAAGGGGKGMRIVADERDFADALQAAQREARAAFGDDQMLVEKYLTAPRHIEVQIFADQHGNVVHLFDRDCSIQRRHQKIIEEAPAPDIDALVRAAMAEAAIAAARAIDYVGAGTVEFLLDEDGSFFFMEMNTRLQVEHPVSEYITGQDFVAWQIAIARGQPLPMAQADIAQRGHAIECRLYAENPDNDFLPDSGRLSGLDFPAASSHTRIDTGVVAGDDISIHYDPMIAKLITFGENRAQALQRMTNALANTRILGPATNTDYLMRILRVPQFAEHPPTTQFVSQYADALQPPAASSADWLAAALAVALPAINSANPWLTNTAWRVNLPAQRIVDLVCGDEQRQVILSFANGGVVSAVMDQWHGMLSAQKHGECIDLSMDGHQTQRIVIESDLRLLVSSLDGHREFLRIMPDLGDETAAHKSNLLRAPMTGRVVAIHKQSGDAVAAQEALIVVEAMKMEHTIRAAAEGHVEDCHVAIGDLVDGDALLMTLEFDTDED
ncbi:MAG: biotin carboxylase N-terminal domain-containing protein [Pseudomonadota bacterium]